MICFYKLCLNWLQIYYWLVQTIRGYYQRQVNISFCKCKVHLKTEIYKISKVWNRILYQFIFFRLKPVCNSVNYPRRKNILVFVINQWFFLKTLYYKTPSIIVRCNIILWEMSEHFDDLWWHLSYSQRKNKFLSEVFLFYAINSQYTPAS